MGSNDFTFQHDDTDATFSRRMCFAQSKGPLNIFAGAVALLEILSHTAL